MISKFQPFAIVLFSIIFPIVGCNKFVEVKSPATSLTGANIYSTDATAAAVLTGIYSQISGTFIRDNFTLRPGLVSDELTLYYGGDINLTAFYTNTLNTNQNLTFWEGAYKYLGTVNTLLEKLPNSVALTPAIRQQLIGEAKFIRAFFYLYLVNFYGDVPLALSSDYNVNRTLSRSPASIVFGQIISDLKDAKNLLTDAYVGADAITVTTERARPNRWAATALLSRAYLSQGDYINAESEATLILNNTSRYGLASLSNVFLKNLSSNNNLESIWQLQPVVSGWNTEDARIFILPSSGPTSTISTYAVYLSSFLVNAFEPGDLRKTKWIGSVKIGPNVFYFPYKYQSATSGAAVTEYQMILRLAEQYLIRSEARAQLSNIPGALLDINMLRSRANLPPLTFSDKPSLLKAILHERQVELFTEVGHRWMDMKRMKAVDSIMSIVTPQKGGIWKTYWQWYPLPLYDIQQNSNLSQNSNY